MKNKERYWEIDTLRGIAVILMIMLHALVDLYLLGNSLTHLNFGLWYTVQKMTVTLFFLLAGVSLFLKSYRRINIDHPLEIFKDYARRGIRLTAWGLFITLSTRVFLSRGYVIFGVLHCIGLSTILAVPFLRLRRSNLWVGLAAISAGIILNQSHPDYPWLLWLGLAPRNFYSVDYVPLLPWFGLILIGIYLGSVFYPRGQRRMCLPDPMDQPMIRGLSYLGRHSLLIYLVHQPLILSIYKIVGLI